MTVTTAIDSSGNGNDGNYANPVTSWTHRVSGIVTGNTASQSVNVGAEVEAPIPLLDLSLPLTMEGWASRPDASLNMQLLNVAQSGGYMSVHVQGTDSLFGGANGTIVVVITSGAMPFFTTSSAVWTDTAPHHLAAAFDPSGGTIDVYFDGSLVQTFSPGAWTVDGSPGSPDVFSFGLAQDGVHAVFDEFAVYQSALSSTRIAAHYAARGSFGSYVAAVMADSPEGFYHLDEPAPINQGWYVGRIGMGS